MTNDQELKDNKEALIKDLLKIIKWRNYISPTGSTIEETIITQLVYTLEETGLEHCQFYAHEMAQVLKEDIKEAIEIHKEEYGD